MSLVKHTACTQRLRNPKTPADVLDGGPLTNHAVRIPPYSPGMALGEVVVQLLPEDDPPGGVAGRHGATASKLALPLGYRPSSLTLIHSVSYIRDGL